MKGKPVVSAKLPGLPAADLRVTKVSHTNFKALLVTKGVDRPGRIVVRVAGTDSADGTQTQAWRLRLN